MECADDLTNDVVVVHRTHPQAVHDVAALRVIVDVHDAGLATDLHLADAHRGLLVQLVRELGDTDDSLEPQWVVAVEQLTDERVVPGEDRFEQLSLHRPLLCPA